MIGPIIGGEWTIDEKAVTGTTFSMSLPSPLTLGSTDSSSLMKLVFGGTTFLKLSYPSILASCDLIAGEYLSVARIGRSGESVCFSELLDKLD